MWELDHKEGWAPKNCCQTVVLEKTLESPLDCKKIKPVNYKGNQSEYTLERLMLKLKLQYLMQRAYSLEKPWCWERLKARGEGDDRGWAGWKSCCPRDSQESSPTPQFKSINSSVLSFILQPNSHNHPYMTTGKTIVLTRRTLVGKVMSLLLTCYLGWS